MNMSNPKTPNLNRVIIIVKATPQPTNKHQEIVCTAGITHSEQWVRLFPISFRKLEETQKFKRWDIVEYTWRRPDNDPRPESRRADQRSLNIVGSISHNERFNLIDPLIVENLKTVHNAGRSFAFVRPRNIRFKIKKRPSDELKTAKNRYDQFTRQANLFEKPLIPYEPCPYSFHYNYELAEGSRAGTCQDWELDGTFFHWRRKYGEQSALERIRDRWGTEFRYKDIVFAMGTHSKWRDTRLINGIIQLPRNNQLTLFKQPKRVIIKFIL